MRKGVGVLSVVAALLAGGGCGGGGAARMEAPVAGASSPEAAVQTFLDAAREAQALKAAGEFPAADRAYDRMAAVFGTQEGSIRNTYPAQEVRDRMVVLAACLRPERFRITSQPDPAASRSRQTVVTAELRRDARTLSLPFRCVLGKDDRWFIEQIQLSSSSFTC